MKIPWQGKLDVGWRYVVGLLFLGLVYAVCLPVIFIGGCQFVAVWRQLYRGFCLSFHPKVVLRLRHIYGVPYRAAEAYVVKLLGDA